MLFNFDFGSLFRPDCKFRLPCIDSSNRKRRRDFKIFKITQASAFFPCLSSSCEVSFCLGDLPVKKQRDMSFLRFFLFERDPPRSAKIPSPECIEEFEQKVSHLKERERKNPARIIFHVKSRGFS